MGFGFGDVGPAGSGMELRTPEDAMKILRHQCLEICSGDLPAENWKRVALVLQAITILTAKTLMFVRIQHPHASVEKLAEAADFATKLLVSAAAFVILDLFGEDFEALSASVSSGVSATPGYRFSRN